MYNLKIMTLALHKRTFPRPCAWGAVAVLLLLLNYLCPCGLFADEYHDYLCKDIHRPFFAVKKVYKNGGKLLGTNRKEAGHRQEFLLPKPFKTKRVFVIGESVAAEFGGGEDSSLTKLAAQVIPSWKLEHINCGMGAYNTTGIALVLDEILDYEPDLVIVFSGNNEGPGGYEVCAKLGHLNRRYQILKERLKSLGASPFEIDRKISLKNHERKLRNMVVSAKKKGIPVVLCTLPANLKDYAPGEIAPFGNELFVRAWIEMENRDYLEAIRLFNNLLEQNPREPFSNYFLARCLERVGRFDEVEKYYEEALEWDSQMDRCSKSRNNNIRKIAREEGVILADLVPAFKQTAPHGLVGDSMITDGVHWFGRYNPLVAYVILKALSKDKTFADEKDWNFEKFNSLYPAVINVQRGKEEFIEENTKILCSAINFLQAWSGGFKNGEIQETTISMLERVDNRDRKFLLKSVKSRNSILKISRENFWAKEIKNNLNEWWPVLLQHLGEMYRRKGESQRSVEFLEKAARLAPNRYMIRLQRGLAYLANGEKDKALSDFNSLASYEKAHPEICHFSKALQLVVKGCAANEQEK